MLTPCLPLPCRVHLLVPGSLYGCCDIRLPGGWNPWEFTKICWRHLCSLCGRQCVLCLQRQSTTPQTLFQRLLSPSSSASRAMHHRSVGQRLLLRAASSLSPAPAAWQSTVFHPASTTRCLSRPSRTCTSTDCFSPGSRSSESRHHPLCISLLPSAVWPGSPPHLTAQDAHCNPAKLPCILGQRQNPSHPPARLL